MTTHYTPLKRTLLQLYTHYRNSIEIMNSLKNITEACIITYCYDGLVAFKLKP